MAFRDLKGQKELKIRLAEVVSARPGNSYLLSGPSGSGKKSFGRELAKAFLCSNPGSDGACGKCEMCRYFEAGTSPDYAEITAELSGKKNISVDTIRSEILADLESRPRVSQVKVFLIDGDELAEEGQNALLKSIEEPPEYVIFIFTSSDINQLLVTVRSRLVMLKLADYTEEEIREIITDSSDGEEFDEEKVKFVASFSGGNPGSAKELLYDDEFNVIRNRLIDMILTIGKETYTDVLYNKFNFFSENKDRIGQILRIMAWILDDMAVLKVSSSAEIRNSDKADQLKKYMASHPNLTVGKIGKCSDAVNDLAKQISSNAVYETACCNFLLKLKKELSDV